MKLIFCIPLIFISLPALAECYGNENYKTCYDDNGNTYDVQRYGNTTTVDGHNSNTGSSWSQDSYTYGNNTSTTGTAANGNSWSSDTTHNSDGSSDTWGTDSEGNSFSSHCDSSGDCY